MTEATELPLVTVIVPTRDRLVSVQRTLAALETQTYERFEVVVVDDGSVDNTASTLRQRHSTVPLVVLEADGRGPAVARNAGLAVARGEIVAFTDSDCVPDREWLSAGVVAFRPEVDIVQGQTQPDAASIRTPFDRSVTVDGLTRRFETCNVFYRAARLKEAGGFDEGFPVPFGEDIEAGWRVLRQGGTAVYSPRAQVWHDVVACGPSWYLTWAQRYRYWPRVTKRCPEIRRDLLFLRVFLEPRRAAFVAALVGVLVGMRYRPALSAALPYLWIRRPRRFDRAAFENAAVWAAFDACVEVALVRGSIRFRSLVL